MFPTDIINLIDSYISPHKINYDFKNSFYQLDVNWAILSGDSNAIEVIEANLDKIDWIMLSSNVNAIHILELHLDKVDWKLFSANKNAIHILKNNLDKVDWSWLSMNPNAIHLIEANLDKVDWKWLSLNKNAVHILKTNTDKIDWDVFLDNTSTDNWVMLTKSHLWSTKSIEDEYYQINCFSWHSRHNNYIQGLHHKIVQDRLHELQW